MGSAEGDENVIEHEGGLFRNERNRRARVRGNIVQRTHGSRSGQPGGDAASLAIKFQRNPIVFLAGRLAARRNQILYVTEAATPQRLRISLLGMRTVYNLADIRGNQNFGAAAVDGSDSLAKICSGEGSCSGIQLCAHLPN